MFSGHLNQPNIRHAAAFNQDTSDLKWNDSSMTQHDMARVANMASAFNGAAAFNGDIGEWNVASVATLHPDPNQD